jgi:hypothetical protein
MLKGRSHILKVNNLNIVSKTYIDMRSGRSNTRAAAA